MTDERLALQRTVTAGIRSWLEGSLPATEANALRDLLREWWVGRDLNLDDFMAEVGARLAFMKGEED